MLEEKMAGFRAGRRWRPSRGLPGTHALGFGDISGFDLRSIALRSVEAYWCCFLYGLIARNRG
jgi:hypothetical protein